MFTHITIGRTEVLWLEKNSLVGTYTTSTTMYDDVESVSKYSMSSKVIVSTSLNDVIVHN